MRCVSEGREISRIETSPKHSGHHVQEPSEGDDWEKKNHQQVRSTKHCVEDSSSRWN